MPYATFSYRVQSTRVVSPSDLGIVHRVGYDRLVLTACHPLYSASRADRGLRETRARSGRIFAGRAPRHPWPRRPDQRRSGPRRGLRAARRAARRRSARVGDPELCAKRVLDLVARAACDGHLSGAKQRVPRGRGAWRRTSAGSRTRRSAAGREARGRLGGLRCALRCRRVGRRCGGRLRSTVRRRGGASSGPPLGAGARSVRPLNSGGTRRRTLGDLTRARRSSSRSARAAGPPGGSATRPGRAGRRSTDHHLAQPLDAGPRRNASASASASAMISGGHLLGAVDDLVHPFGGRVDDALQLRAGALARRTAAAARPPSAPGRARSAVNG